MEEKAKMNSKWNFFRFNFRQDKSQQSNKQKQTEQPLRHVYANARAGDKVSFFINGDMGFENPFRSN